MYPLSLSMIARGLLASFALLAYGSPAYALPRLAETPSHFLTEDRETRRESAEKAFLSLAFFKDGEGMHLPPLHYQIIKAGESLGKRIPALQPIIGLVNKHQIGMVYTPEHGMVGLFEREVGGVKTGVFGCAVCHVGKAAGRFYVGLGNKNMDVASGGRNVVLADRLLRKVPNLLKAVQHKPAWTAMRDNAIDFWERVSMEPLANDTQGLVSIAVIQDWFYRVKGETRPPGPKGQIKIPAMWGYGEKRKIASFCDGAGNGMLPGGAIGVELAAGQSPETVMSYVGEIEKAEGVLADLLPPPYPFAIDREKGKRGEAHFARYCAGCHGTYERDAVGLPVYRTPRFIPQAAVGTDSDRIDSVDDAFLAHVDGNPLHEILQSSPLAGKRMYVANRLDGIWARFPYLHNASVPSLAALLEEPSKRPVVFSIWQAGEAERFDQQTVGLTMARNEREAKEFFDKGARGAREIYDTRRAGHSNAGHAFGTELSPDEKLELIEYMKQL